ncbi:MAG: M48 family metallopeptidase [bacterium]
MEKILGETVKEAFALQYGFLDNRLLQNWIDTIGGKFSKEINMPLNFYILNTDQVNAYATFGNNIFLTKGLLETVDSEDELAGVLAHETAHIKLKHPQKQTGIILLSLALLSSFDLSETKRILAKSLLALSNLSFSRMQEKQADIEGIAISLKSGFNPKGLVHFLRKLGEGKSPRWAEYFSTHPFPSHRIAICEEHLQRIKEDEWERVYQSLKERGEGEEARELNPIKAPSIVNAETRIEEPEKGKLIEEKIASLYTILNQISQWQSSLLISPLPYELYPLISETFILSDKLKGFYSETTILYKDVNVLTEKLIQDKEEKNLISGIIDALEKAKRGGEKLLLVSAGLAGASFAKHSDELSLLTLQSLLLSSGNDIAKAVEGVKKYKHSLILIGIEFFVERLNFLDNEWLRKKCAHRLGISVLELSPKPLGESCLMKCLAISSGKNAVEIEEKWKEESSLTALFKSLKMEKKDIEAIYIFLNSLLKGN